MDKVVNMYNNNKTHEEIKSYIDKNVTDVELTITNDNNKYVNIEVAKEVDIFTPGLKLIIGDPFFATVKRVLPYE